MFSVNQEAVRIVKEKIIPNAEMLQCEVHQLKNGATSLIWAFMRGAGIWQENYSWRQQSVTWAMLTSGASSSARLTFPPLMSILISLRRQPSPPSSRAGNWVKILKEVRLFQLDRGLPVPSRKLILARRGGVIRTFITKQCLRANNRIADEAMAEDVAKKCGLKSENVYIPGATRAAWPVRFQVLLPSVELPVLYVQKGVPLESVSAHGHQPDPSPDPG